MGETAELDPLVGRVLAGRYEILAPLGKGAMGAVYRARQVSMDRQVAIKVIHRHLLGSEEVVARFRREMQALCKLEHPGTVRVYDYGQTESGQLYLVMELLAGQTLWQALREGGPMPAMRLCPIAAQVTRALLAAHREGIVHRDLKPDNVMLLSRHGERDVVKVLDFGIARSLRGEEDVERLTARGALLGTPAYMSPEQAQGQAAGPAADLYALGVMLYQLATGRLPFQGETLPTLLVQHVREAPPPPSEVAEVAVGPALSALILDLLAKDPAARPDEEAVLSRLEACLKEADPGQGAAGIAGGAAGATGAGAAPPAWRRRMAGVGIVLGVAGVVFGVGLGWLGLRQREAERAARARWHEALAAEGEPAAPAGCQARGARRVRVLAEAAGLLAGGEPSAAPGREQDRRALALLLREEAGLSGEAEYWALRARALLWTGGDPAEGAGAAAEALRRCPGFAAAHNLRGNLLQRAGRLAEAEAEYGLALAGAADYVTPRYNIGLLALRAGSPQEAVLAMDEVLGRSPGHELAHLLRGQARLRLRQPERALPDLEEAVRRQPRRQEAWLLLGQARGALGQKAAAMEAFCKARELGAADAPCAR